MGGRARWRLTVLREAQSWASFWFVQDHIAWFGEREWHAAGERVSRYGVSTGPGEHAGSLAIVRVADLDVGYIRLLPSSVSGAGSIEALPLVGT